MTKYEIVSSTQAHAQALAQNMRKSDVREVWACSHVTPAQVLSMSVDQLEGTMTGLADGEVVCMFGVNRTGLLSMVGVPWLLSSKSLPKHAKAFLRRNKQYIDEIKQDYGILVNYVDARNRTSIKWLKWLGFKFDAAKPYGLDQLPFHRFEMKGAD